MPASGVPPRGASYTAAASSSSPDASVHMASAYSQALGPAAAAAAAAGGPPPGALPTPGAAPVPAASSGAVRARVAVLFASGQFCIFDLDAANKLRLVPGASVAACQRLGLRALDLAWMPHAGSSAGRSTCLLGVVSDEGGLVLLDVGPRPGKAARAATQHMPLIADDMPRDESLGRGAAEAGQAAGWNLAPAPSMGSCLLLPRPWALLLRLLLQVCRLVCVVCAPGRRGMPLHTRIGCMDAWMHACTLWAGGRSE